MSLWLIVIIYQNMKYLYSLGKRFVSMRIGKVSAMGMREQKERQRGYRKYLWWKGERKEDIRGEREKEGGGGRDAAVGAKEQRIVE